MDLLSNLLSSGVFDFVVADSELLMRYAYGYNFIDLTTVLTEQQLEYYKPYLRYIVIEVLSERLETHTDIPFPDCMKPEDMQQPIPVMVDLSQCKAMQQYYGQHSKNLVFATLRVGEHQENTLNFLDHLMNQ